MLGQTAEKEGELTACTSVAKCASDLWERRKEDARVTCKSLKLVQRASVDQLAERRTQAREMDTQ